MEYQELVNKCREEYYKSDLASAYKYWEEMFNVLDEKLNQYDKTDEKNRFVCYDEFNKCMREFTDDEVYKITDYGREKAYREMELERTYNILDKSVKCVDLVKNNDKMKYLDEFLNFYEWCILKSEDKKGFYNIYDLQTNEVIDNYSETNEKDKTLNETILRLVNKALCYELDEREYETDEEYDEYYNTQYIQALLGIQEEYTELVKEDLQKELDYQEKRIEVCGYGKSDLHNIEHLKWRIDNL